jgi:NAD kinase
MVHPNIPAILLTPICPHSLSFRPILLPDYAELDLRIPEDARCVCAIVDLRMPEDARCVCAFVQMSVRR